MADYRVQSDSPLSVKTSFSRNHPLTKMASSRTTTLNGHLIANIRDTTKLPHRPTVHCKAKAICRNEIPCYGGFRAVRFERKQFNVSRVTKIFEIRLQACGINL